ncbi:ionic transporter y4hA [Martelella mediterranea]|uniref:calcium:proton antiporter n=1 Tax=Martelella mediterranea TaxID=293089 RepID=UPI001E3187C8|nr:ionic transporter y4hA [Martelella mediterranea]MCD1633934.1 ionic transporter y4hA [Martelella mediterranea]
MHARNSIPRWSLLLPIAAFAWAALEITGVLHDTAMVFVLPAILLLGGSVFASVLHAEVLGARLGEPMGSIILACCVTLIEVALIISIMLSGIEGGEEVARDTVFAAVMIVLNGIIGLCLVRGGRIYHEQSFKLPAASAALAVLGTLSTLAFVLPNFAISGADRQYSWAQLLVISLCCLTLYGVFLFVQTVRHRNYFVDDADEAPPAGEDFFPEHPEKPSARMTAISAVMLPVSLLVVILLAEALSHPLDLAITAAGLPHALVGVVIAALVLLPEGISSVQAAARNRIQQSINLVLGSALASIGMSIPIVALVSIFIGQQLTLGLEPEQMVMLLLTLFVSTLTLGTGRTTVLQGAVHLVIFVVFVLLTLVP